MAYKYLPLFAAARAAISLSHFRGNRGTDRTDYPANEIIRA